MFQEFPKMLFKGDAHSIVDDAEQETALRADGWHDFGKDTAPDADAKPARRKKSDTAQDAD
jgi:hypothetical protein